MDQQWPVEPTFMHASANARMGRLDTIPPDSGEAARAVVPRIIAAYQRALAEFREPGRSMWDDIKARNTAFCTALECGDEGAVFEMLRGMFQSSLIWGLGFVEEQVTRTDHDRDHYLRLLADAVRSLAESAGVLRVTCIEQEGAEAWLRALDVNLDDLVRGLAACGVDVSFPEISGAYGSRLDGRFVSVDSVVQSALVCRLRQLGAESASSIIEIGGGYGCHALKAFHAGLRVQIYDLPWVNAVQGYFLSLGAGPDRVSLFGEPPADIRVLPHWRLETIPDRSIDFAISSNAIAEMNPDTATDCVRQIDRVLRGVFLSIGQEAQTRYRELGPQNRVLTLAARTGRLRLDSRQLWWMRQGYIEETYRVPAQTLSRRLNDGIFNASVRCRRLAARGYHSSAGKHLFRAQPVVLIAASIGELSDLAPVAPRVRPLDVRIGHARSPLEDLSSGSRGLFHLRCKAGDRIELHLGERVDAAYAVRGERLFPLPMGAAVDLGRGQFVWQTPLAGLGALQLLFASARERTRVAVTIADPTDASEIALHLDAPLPDATVSGALVVAGWTLDPRATSGIGIINLQVTVARAGEGSPIIADTASVGGVRPDVASIFGDQFDRAGFTLTIPSLPAGSYDVRVRPRPRRRGAIAPTSMVRISKA
jgi:hypothetical protein